MADSLSRRFPLDQAAYAAQKRAREAAAGLPAANPAAYKAPAKKEPAHKAPVQAAPAAPTPVQSSPIQPAAASYVRKVSPAASANARGPILVPAQTAVVQPHVMQSQAAPANPVKTKPVTAEKPAIREQAQSEIKAPKAGSKRGGATRLRRLVTGIVAFAGALTVSFNKKSEMPVAPQNTADSDNALTKNPNPFAGPRLMTLAEKRAVRLTALENGFEVPPLLTIGRPVFAAVSPENMQGRINTAFVLPTALPLQGDLHAAFIKTPFSPAVAETERAETRETIAKPVVRHAKTPKEKKIPARALADIPYEAPVVMAYAAYEPAPRRDLADVFGSLLGKPAHPLAIGGQNEICSILKPQPQVVDAAIKSLPKAARGAYKKVSAENWPSLCNAVVAAHRAANPDFPVSTGDVAFENTARFTKAILDVNPRAFDFLLSPGTRKRFVDVAHIKPSPRKLRVIDFGHGVKLPGGAYDGGAADDSGRDETDYLKIVGPRLLPSLLADKGYDTVATRLPNELIHDGPLTKSNDLHKRKMILMATGLLSGRDQRAMISFHLDSAEGRPRSPFGVNIFSNPKSSLSATFAAALRTRLFAQTQSLTQSATSSRVMRADGEHIVVVELANINSPVDLRRMLAADFAPNMLKAIAGISGDNWARSPTLVAEAEKPQRVVRAGARRPART